MIRLTYSARFHFNYSMCYSGVSWLCCTKAFLSSYLYCNCVDDSCVFKEGRKIINSVNNKIG